MLLYFHRQLGGRRVRLFACLCCRRIWPLLSNPASRAAVEAGERYAEGAADDRELDAAWRAACAAAVEAADDDRPRDPHSLSARAAMHAADFDLWGDVYEMAAWEYAANAAGKDVAAERATQAALLRCVVGNPFLPDPARDPAWLAWNCDTVAKLAAAIYDGRRFADLPILADALEDAGCSNTAILAHCRSAGEHVRGCWVLDLLMGRP
jgi:hypothetical protein